jgi:hypothetical protein
MMLCSKSITNNGLNLYLYHLSLQLSGMVDELSLLTIFIIFS